jgi:hypothetical protein
MDSHLNRHTFGLIQSRLVPFYLHLGSLCAFLNLTLFAVYHPADLLDDREAFQVTRTLYPTILLDDKEHFNCILISFSKPIG